MHIHRVKDYGLRDFLQNLRARILTCADVSGRAYERVCDAEKLAGKAADKRHAEGDARDAGNAWEDFHGGRGFMPR